MCLNYSAQIQSANITLKQWSQGSDIAIVGDLKKIRQIKSY